jgi:hypothetical protein
MNEPIPFRRPYARPAWRVVWDRFAFNLTVAGGLVLMLALLKLLSSGMSLASPLAFLIGLVPAIAFAVIGAVCFSIYETVRARRR